MKPSIPKGTRDFSPEQVNRRNYLFGVIREVFVRYGYQPIETPAMENLSTLTGKYGEEGDKLLFKVLNNGDFLAKANSDALAARDSASLAPSIARRGLRYDLTVPFARYVVMHQHEIAMPFKRYQIQPVWRADRPQRGRYQEFYQCDADVVGVKAMVYEAELAKIYDEVFRRLGLRVVIRVNHRQLLFGIAELAGIADRFVVMTTAIDKIDKVGWEGAKAEMSQRGIPEKAIAMLEPLLSGQENLDALRARFAPGSAGAAGVAELDEFFEYLALTERHCQVRFDATLARGLGYYTGCIFEVTLDAQHHPEVKMGSLGGGGRYDDLTGVFGLAGTPGVGISFGAERIYDVLEALELFPAEDRDAPRVVFLALDVPAHRHAFACLQAARDAGINADIYPEPAKPGKQIKYAEARGAEYVVIIGEGELKSGQLSLKNLRSREQTTLALEQLIEYLSPVATPSPGQ